MSRRRAMRQRHVRLANSAIRFDPLACGAPTGVWRARGCILNKLCCRTRKRLIKDIVVFHINHLSQSIFAECAVLSGRRGCRRDDLVWAAARYYYIYTGIFKASSIQISYPISRRATSWNILSLVLPCDLRV
jgi:hypothetical protein